MENKTLALNLKDIYQLLITECRYGYTRMNHLMPGGAYEKVKRILPQMLEIDPDYTAFTAKQLCEECISDNLNRNFYTGEDDEYENRKEAIEFIEWLLDFVHLIDTERYKDEDKRSLWADKAEYWKPWNIESYYKNLEHDNDKIYNIYELTNNDEYPGNKTFIAGPLSVKEYPNFLFDQILGEEKECTYHKIRINNDFIDNETGKYTHKPASFRYEFLTPVKKIYRVEHI